ncbi:MAG: hypothetical protein ACYSUP_08240 [Planctomycetota bacterium]
MSKKRHRKPIAKVKAAGGRGRHAGRREETDTLELARRERHFEVFAIIALLVFGIYQSVLYFGHTVVPVSDFPDLFKVGRDILSFQLPSRFKQTPVLGMLQFILSWFVGGQNPPLTAGWLLNAILHPLNLVLLWLVGKRIVGRSALWLAVIAILHPWVIYMLTEPLIETTLLFFTLLTFYLMFRRSKWCYLVASITTMVRYEGVMLVLAAFVMDMIHAKDRREKIRAFACSAAAAVPMALWMLATVLTWKPGTSHYLNVLFTKEYAKGFTEQAANRTGLVLHMKLLWRVGFQPLLTAYPKASADFADMLEKLSKVLAVSGFFFGSAWGLLKRRWQILALLIFFVPYFVLHALYPYPLPRFHTNIFWIALLICWFGFQSGWGLLDKNGRVPRAATLVLQGLSATIAVIWLFSLLPHLAEVSRRASPTSFSLPYVAMLLVTAVFAGRVYVYRARHLLRELCILGLTCLVIASNHFGLVGLVRDGQKEVEFKQLAEWYTANARPDEKLGVYMAGVVRMFTPDHAEYIVRLPKADNPQKFIEACYENDITYVVWATREGARGGHTGYRQTGLDRNIAALRNARDTGPYEFVTQVGSKNAWVNIFRLRKPAAVGPGPPPGS